MDRKPTGQSSDATWSLIETLNEISTRFLDHRRSLANFRDLESYGKLLFGTIDGLGGGSETFISRAILELLANNKTRQDEKGEWVEIHETDLRAYARRLMDEIYHCGTESITQSTRDALEWARWCYEAMLKSPKCEDLDENTGCRNSHDVAFLKEHRIRRLNALVSTSDQVEYPSSAEHPRAISSGPYDPIVLPMACNSWTISNVGLRLRSRLGLLAPGRALPYQSGHFGCADNAQVAQTTHRSGHLHSHH